MNLKSFGDKNPNNKFYVIWRRRGGAGFFSNLFHVLGEISIAEKNGLVPIVDMENHKTFYNEKVSINGSFNAWEYYFEQLTDVSLKEVYQSKTVYLSDGEFKDEIYKISENNIEYINYLIKKYIKMKRKEEVENFYKKNFLGNKILGVHIRGQEQKFMPKHATPPSIKEMIEKTEKILSNCEINKIFIVTEDKGYLESFKREFGDLIIHTEAFRTYEGENAYYIRPYPRELHMYKLGNEILNDVILLSKADILLASGKDGIASGSNVSRFAQVLNAGKYNSVELIYKGINSTTLRGMWEHLYSVGRRCLNSL